MIAALFILTVWAFLRADILLESWAETDQVEFYANQTVAQFDRDYPNGFFGFYGLYDCNAHYQRTGERLSNCRDPRPKELGSLKDPLLASGYVAALIGLWLSIWLEPLYARLSRQLLRDQIVPWTLEDTARIDWLRRYLSVRVAVVVVLTLGAGFWAFHYDFRLPPTPLDWEHFLSALLLGAIAGHRLGTAAAMGWIGRTVARRDNELALVLGHSDGMGGARYFGEFVAYQGVLIAVPILFLSFWIAALYPEPSPLAGYASWFWPYVALLLISLAISIFSFLTPLAHFSHRFRRARHQALEDWTAKSSPDLARLRRTAHTEGRWSLASDAMNDAERITSVTRRLEHMPDIPVGLGLRSSLSVSTLIGPAVVLLEMTLPNDQPVLALILGTLGGLVGGG